MSNPTYYLTEAEWLAGRLKGIGSSDAPCIVGANPWRSARDLWLEKTGQSPGEVENTKMLAGKVMEPAIADFYALTHPEVDVIHPRGPNVGVFAVSWSHPQVPFLAATPDRLLLCRTRNQSGVLEIKNCGPDFHGDWDAEPPLRVQVQVQHQMLVLSAAGCNVQFARVAAYFGSDDLRVFDVERDDAFLEKYVRRAGRFWEHVLSRTEPPIDESEAMRKSLLARYPTHVPAKTCEVDRETFAQWLAASGDVAEAETRADLFKNEIMAQMQDAEIGLIDGAPVLSWKSSTVNHKPKDAWVENRRTMRKLKGAEAFK